MGEEVREFVSKRDGDRERENERSKESLREEKMKEIGRDARQKKKVCVTEGGSKIK
jgi:hypothetical protein